MQKILATLSRFIAKLTRRFAADRRGNLTTIFAITLIPLIGLTGAAVDYSRASKARTEMQLALDATALAVSSNAPSLTSAQLQTNALAYFNALYKSSSANGVTFSASYTTTGGSQVVLTASDSVKADFMGIMGFKQLAINASATSAWGNARLRVALVLDNTGSMADSGKIAALKTATNNLLTQLKGAASKDGDVYVSIIPFSNDVNAGASYYNATWIDWTDWNAENQTCNYGGWNCSPANHNTWNGCIADRGNSAGPASQNYDQNVLAPSSTAASKYPADQSDYCPKQIMGLNYNWSAMTTLVNSLSASGATNQPIGLVWGWLSLVGGGPLTMPAMDANYTYQQVIILLSDGLNTQDRWYGNGSQVSTQVDARMYNSSNGSGTCANVKAAGIIIYAIQVNTAGDPTSTLLQKCATDASKFFLLTSATQIVTTFGQIGTNLTHLRIAK